MKQFLLILTLIAIVGVASAIRYEARIVTDKGDIVVRLYDNTPKHRDNFVKLAREGFYDSLLFHRVIAKFMVQSGDPTSLNAPSGTLLGDGDPGHTLDAEIVPNNYHKKGALAAAREGDEVNPRKRSSGSQFYITVASAGHLNGKYTVFGEIVEGIEVAEKISRVATDKADRPKQDIRIKNIEIYEREN